ncbi:hypothetical protein DB346_05355 [Verrucomicrobia bacterium LW23]|nr:hypothetical protein DB346_05355 [Verrucomicrobia bacterium LW23]
MARTKQPPPDYVPATGKSIYDIQEAAELLRLGVTVLRKLITAGEISYVRYGGRGKFYFTRDDINSFIKNSRTVAHFERYAMPS